jgi:chemotaxis protein MotB
MSEGKKHRKHVEEHHEEAHEGEGPWIVSYADMMTLLFCFFVIMTSFASFEPAVVSRKSKEIADYVAKGRFTEETTEFQNLGIEIGGHPNLKGLARSSLKDGTLEVVFSSSIMFNSGNAEIQEAFIKNIDIMVGLIKNKNPNYRIIVEGHSDDSPLSADHVYRSNWDLSASRAASVVERFIYYGFKPIQLVSAGFGDSRPVAPNHDKHGQAIKENQALNRRVVIKVLQPLKSSKMKNLGIESYFENSEILKK